MSTPVPNLEAIRVLAANVARTLRECPEAWCQKYLVHGEQACLIGQIQGHLAAVVAALNIEDALQLECEARHAFCVAAGVRHRRKGIDLLGPWNDAPGRTIEDVIALCDRVAQAPIEQTALASMPEPPLPTMTALRGFLKVHHDVAAWDEGVLASNG